MPVNRLNIILNNGKASYKCWSGPHAFRAWEQYRSTFLMEASNDQGNGYWYRQLLRSAPFGALSAIRFMILGTYMLLYLSRLMALG